MPGGGESRYLDVRLTGVVRLADALNHLYVLLPVLDDAKHYWVSTDEVDKLVRAGGDWLAHPEKELITRRYLAHKRELTRDALARLAEVGGLEPEDLDNAPDRASVLEAPDRPTPLSEQRRAPSSPPSARPAPGLSATSAAARACWSATYSRSARSSGWWPPTCPRGRCRSPRAGSGSTR
jgi:RNA repair, ligase-Pnkp-associating, region of Hen1